MPMKRVVILLLLLLGHLGAIPVVDAGAEAPSGQNPGSELVTLEAELTADGSTLLSVPLDLGELDVGQWLVSTGLSARGIHGWNAQRQQYQALGTLRPGEGFLLARGPGKVSIQGRNVVVDTVEVALEKGWNLIGAPYATGIPLAATRVRLDGNHSPYVLAAEKKWVGGVNSLVNGQMREVSADGNAMLEPWRGYWFYAYQPCVLLIPSPESLVKGKGGKGKTSGRH